MYLKFAGWTENIQGIIHGNDLPAAARGQLRDGRASR